jgi:hypothetical protein
MIGELATVLTVESFLEKTVSIVYRLYKWWYPDTNQDNQDNHDNQDNQNNQKNQKCIEYLQHEIDDLHHMIDDKELVIIEKVKNN